MQSLKNFAHTPIKYVFTDIDDTITTKGQLPADSYQALWQLHNFGIKVIPVTGRPAGFCEMIARFWPVQGVIGENGGFYFTYKNQQMIRHYSQPEEVRLENQKKLNIVKDEILNRVPNAGIASDQFCRQLDLAIDFCEDVAPLTEDEIQLIVEIFKKHGAQAKVSSIHVNGWFGEHNKLSMCREFCKNEFKSELGELLNQCAFIGDSPNDEPMFEYFTHSFAVANIKQFLNQLNHKPTYITEQKGGDGFCEFANQLIKNLG